MLERGRVAKKVCCDYGSCLLEINYSYCDYLSSIWSNDQCPMTFDTYPKLQVIKKYMKYIIVCLQLTPSFVWNIYVFLLRLRVTFICNTWVLCFNYRPPCHYRQKPLQYSSTFVWQNNQPVGINWTSACKTLNIVACVQLNESKNGFKSMKTKISHILKKL